MTNYHNANNKPVRKTQQELTDNDLVILIRKKFPERYQEIIARYQNRLFVYLYRLIGNREEVEDLLQNVFLKVYKNLKSYDSDRKFSSWIYRIAHNEAVNYIKRKSLKKFISWEDISSVRDKLESSSNEEGVAEAWMRKEMVREVTSALDKLPLKYKQVLLLRYFSDKSYKEIGKILKKPVNTVGTLINRAKKNLEEEFGKTEKLKKQQSQKKPQNFRKVF